ncbi:NADH-quinone oxidoreductase subunit C [Candidatus Saganbacteria bacterium]|nr:NADH-quinone oxidoreductase subunit C [Candidatus Saganbacteria bacterium]
MTEEKKISREELLATGENIKAQYNFLVFITAVDYPERNVIGMVYHLRSLGNRDTLIIKIDLPREKPEIASVAGIWPAAEWHEREVFDLFGVNFLGHPDLRRILLPPDWEGSPLRKDYTKPGVIKRPETIK